MINQTQIMMLDIKLSVIQKFWNLFNATYILLKDDIIVTEAPATQVSFKSCALFSKFVIKIDGTTIDDAGD